MLWVVLVAAYATTLGIDAGAGVTGSEYAPGEARVLLAAESIVSDGDVDLRDEYRSRAYDDWIAGDLPPAAGLTGGHLHEPPGVGLPLLVAPAYALAGPIGAELLVAALLALGFVAAAALARRLVPEPWATWAALVAGLSPPALGWATAVSPEPVAAAAAGGAALFALRSATTPAGSAPSWRRCSSRCSRGSARSSSGSPSSAPPRSPAGSAAGAGGWPPSRPWRSSCSPRSCC